MNAQGFTPAFNGTLTFTATATSANLVFGAGASMQEVLIQNAGTGVAFFRWGNTTQTALVTDCPILPGAVMIATIGLATNFAVISPAGTTVYVTPCEGA